jgi:hypothetical protein
MGREITMPLSRSPDEILEEFFVKDGVFSSNGKKRSSIFLALNRDMRILRGIDLTSPPISMTTEQQRAFNDRIPSFGFILVFCSSVDVLARVWKKRVPDKNKKLRNGKNEGNGSFFMSCARRWYGMTAAQARELYRLRNSVSHQYIVSKNQGAYAHGFSGVMKRGLNSSWLFNLNGMYGAFTKVKREFYQYVITLPPGAKRKMAEYIDSNGFFWTPHN